MKIDILVIKQKALIIQNLCKSLFLIHKQVIEYEDALSYLDAVDFNIILLEQLHNLKEQGFVYVVCTCIFFIADYDKKLLNS